MRTLCVMQASPVMHAFGEWVERIASPITAQLHHLSLVCKQSFWVVLYLKSEVYVMSESKLRELSMEFSVDIIELVKHLKSIKESIISNQIGRSGTSIGANIHEAQYAQGKKGFYFKT